MSFDDGSQIERWPTWRLRWIAPPGWTQPNAASAPTTSWRIGMDWPTAPAVWLFWMPLDASGQPYVRWADLPVGLVGPITAAPLPTSVWVAPPKWPTPPPGWSPPPDWMPDRKWKPAPPGWQFWRVREETADEAVRREASTQADMFLQLNKLEHVFVMALWRLRSNEVPDVTDVRLGAVVNHNHPTWRGFVGAVVQLIEAVRGASEHLQWALQSGSRVREEYVQWRLLVDERTELYRQWTSELAREKQRRAYALIGDRLDVTTMQGISDRTVGPPAFVELGSTREMPAGLLDSGPATMTPGWKDAEIVAAETLKVLGFADATLTQWGADGGLDVFGTMVAAQVKYMITKVGRPVLQQLIGAAGDRYCVCFSRSGYTAEAIEFAAERDIALFTIELPTDVRPVNPSAKQLVESSSS